MSGEILDPDSNVEEQLPSLEDVEALLSFLPRFERPDRAFVKKWSGGEKDANGVVTVPYPVYEDDVLAFFFLAGGSVWSDSDYEPVKAREMLDDDVFIVNCTLAQFKTMLTFCVRGERFIDGHWDRLLKSGRISVLLRRLRELRTTLASDS